MKKISVLLCLLLLLTGCAGKQTAQTPGDFSAALPAGYAVEDVTDQDCAIVSAEGTAVGGMAVTGLTHKDLTDSKTKNILLYLQDSFHQTNDVAFFATNWSKEAPFVAVKMQKNGEETAFSHTFFEKGGTVYHLWLRLDLVDEETAQQLRTAVLPGENR